jgi:tRNA threonylcarbamoyladenosine biosynthesis protein TsaE
MVGRRLPRLLADGICHCVQTVQLVTPICETYNRRAMPILDERALDFISHAPEQTVRLGMRLGELLAPGDVLCLRGDLGSGKTTFVSGLARGWGALEAATSPTFVLVNEYRRADGRRMFHLDCFRLKSGAEALAFGFEDVLAEEGVTVIEWPEHIAEVLPAERLTLSLRWVDTEKRNFRLDANGGRYESLLKEFRRAAFGGS